MKAHFLKKIKKIPATTLAIKQVFHLAFFSREQSKHSGDWVVMSSVFIASQSINKPRFSLFARNISRIVAQT
jgi:hypothetical protein